MTEGPARPAAMPLRTKIPAPMMFVMPIDAAPKVPISRFNEVPMKDDSLFVWYILYVWQYL